MNLSNKLTHISFMRDDSWNDGHAETIFDYVVSWMLRIAQSNNEHYDKEDLLWIYCRRFLCMLLGREVKTSDEVSVRVWKQVNRIDLVVQVLINGQEYDICIENKYYTKLRQEQLKCYRMYFESTWMPCYAGENAIPIYVLLTMYDDSDNDKIQEYYSEQCVETGYKIFNWDQMQSAMSGPNETLKLTENDIFDEFWIHW